MNEAKLVDCSETIIEHAYFGWGSSLKFMVDKDSIFAPDLLDHPWFVPIYTGRDLAGWVKVKCLGVVAERIVFEAVELCPADFQVPSKTHVLILS